MNVDNYEIRVLEKMKGALGKQFSPDRFFPAEEFPDRELLNAILLKYQSSDIAKIHAVGIPRRVDMVVPEPGCILRLEKLKGDVALGTGERPITQKKTSNNLLSFWNLLHPKIIEIAKSRFESGHFADSVEAAFKEVNNIVKALVKKETGQEFDGADLMNRAFSLQTPIIRLDDLNTQTGKDVQKGYMQIFSGAMIGIRNPKAHDNITIDERRAIHFLFLASLLMYKIDERSQG